MNPFLAHLGFGPCDRGVVIHADDVSLCQASLDAFADLMDVGLVSSGSLMVPCPWFPATARFCREHPDVDMGVHFTLNCEWQDYRWGPISTLDPASGLVDAGGYCPRSLAELWEKAQPRSAIHEVQAQLARALTAGVDVTHLDEHMNALAHPNLLPVYTEFALRQRIPLRWRRAEGPEPAQEYAATEWRQRRRLAEAGFPMFDFGAGLPLDDPDGQQEMLRDIFDRLPEGGLSLIVAHPARDTAELRAIAPEWPSRVANVEAFASRGMLAYVRQRGIQVIGFRPLQQYLNSTASGPEIQPTVFS